MTTIKTKFKIRVKTGGDLQLHVEMLNAFRSCGIPIDYSHERWNGNSDYLTHIDVEKQFAVESMARRLALLPYAIIDLLDECHGRGSVTVSIESFYRTWDSRQIHLFTINEDYRIDYELDTKPRLN